MTGPWFVAWSGTDPDTGLPGVTVDRRDGHAEADRHAHNQADQRGGTATVHKPDGTPVAAYTSTPKATATSG